MADLKVIKTAAEQGLADAFASARGSLPGAAAVKSLRDNAFQTFEARGLPNRRVEQWKYTDLRALMRDAKPLAPPPDAAAIAKARSAALSFAKLDCYRATFVDGHFVSELSNLPDLAEAGFGVTVLTEPLAPNLRFGGWYLESESRQSRFPRNPMIELNTAFVTQGLHVDVWDTPSKPLHVAHVRTSEKAELAFTRVLVSTVDDRQFDLIESFEDLSGAAHQTNAVTEVVVGDRAQVRRVLLNRESPAALHVDNFIATLHANSRLESLAMTLGGAVSRSESLIMVDGQGGHAGIRGATLLKGRQHADHTLVMNHAVGHCESRELFKAVLDDESRSVFQGKINVEPNAQKTDAKMATHALLLSEDAEADAKPELEIFADDVVCGHGATAGALDDDLLFYLRARGIPQKEAEALMVEAFIGEVVESIGNEALREELMDLARAWLRARQ
jgi:Fe-S cluster assembly protein SufD